MTKLGVENNNWTQNQVDAYGLGYDPDSVHSMNTYYEVEGPVDGEASYHSKQKVWSKFDDTGTLTSVDNKNWFKYD